MNDADIRESLLKTLRRRHDRSSGTVIVEEFGVCQGDARADLAVINGSIHGYEIKSERDTLNRLAAQETNYSRVFDYVTLVTSSSHLGKIKSAIPSWWGIREAKYVKGELRLTSIRKERRNNDIDPAALVQLLWRDEAIELLRERKLHQGIVAKPRKEIWRRVVDSLTLDELRSAVREKIKMRKRWRFAAQP